MQSTTSKITIRPSARKGIHDYCDDSLSKGSKDMGKYGLESKNTKQINYISQQRSLPSHKNGVDEVDNATRNFPIQSSPKINAKTSRKNSIDGSKHMQSSESDDEDISDENNSLETLPNLSPNRRTENLSNVSGFSNLSPQNQCIYRQTSQNDHLIERNDGSYRKQFFLITLIAITGIFVHYTIRLEIYNYSYSDILKLFYENNKNIIYNETNFHKDVLYLGEKYKVTDDSMLQIRSGISTIFHRQDVGSFIFTYNSRNANFNLTHLNNFINDISSTAAKYLRNDSDVQNHVTLDSTELDMREHSELIKRYREVVSRTGVMLVKDLDKVPSTLAMAFHYYCDEFNPLIKKSAIFFTLNMAKCADHTTSHANIEKCLANKWTGIPKVQLLPLLTRIVSIVVDVTNVF